MPRYLMEVRSWIGDASIGTRYFIDAESEQKAKFWFHRHFKTFGSEPSWSDEKHVVDVGNRVVELEEVTKLTKAQSEIAPRLLYEFAKHPKL